MAKKKKIIKVKKFKKSRNKTDLKLGKTESGKEVKAEIEKQFKRELYFKPKKDKFVAIILRKTKSALLVYVPCAVASFSINRNTYFTVEEGTYLSRTKKTLLCVYLEGCCLPISHHHIQYEKHYVLLLNKDGQAVKDLTEDVDKREIPDLPHNEDGDFIRNEKGFIVKKVLDRIKGLEIDSVIADTVFNAGLIERVGHGYKPEKFFMIMAIMVGISLILNIVTIATVVLRTG